MKRLIIFCGILSGCVTSGERIMKREEALRHGLTGVIYDAPLCPTKIENDVSRVSGPCEYVTCTPDGKSVVCVARKKKP